MDLANRIVLIRNRLGLSQEKFGELVDKSQRTVAAWEAGDRMPSFSTLCQLADVFHVSVDYLLGRTDIPNIYFDTEKNPSSNEKEQVFELAQKTLTTDTINQKLPQDVAELTKLIQQIVSRELDMHKPPTDDPS